MKIVFLVLLTCFCGIYLMMEDTEFFAACTQKPSRQ